MMCPLDGVNVTNTVAETVPTAIDDHEFVIFQIFMSILWRHGRPPELVRNASY
jgi:hypothetical protein